MKLFKIKYLLYVTYNSLYYIASKLIIEIEINSSILVIYALQDPQIEGEMDQSNLETKSTIRHVISKSFGVFFWPITKSWNIFKGFIGLPRNIFSRNKEVKGENNNIINFNN